MAELNKMYPGIPFSPQTNLAQSVGSADVVIYVDDASGFPDGPNYATIGIDGDAETIFYATKTAETLSGCVRGVEGTAREWNAGEIIGRYWTAKDFNDMIHNIEKVSEESGLASAASVAAKVAADNAEAAAANAAANAENAAQLSGANTTELAAVKKQQSETDLRVSLKFDGAYIENGYMYFTSDDEVVLGPIGPLGGSGGASNNATLTFLNTSGWLSKTIAEGASCVATSTWQSLEDGVETGTGVLQVSVNGVIKSTQEVEQGDISVDLGDYVSSSSNKVKLILTDTYGNSRTINFTITVVAVSLSSPFDASQPFTGSIVFPYIATGSVTKTMHFVLDGKEIGTTETSVSGRQQSYAIGAQSHGAHTLQAYFTAEVDGQEIKSNELYYEIACVEVGNTDVIITSSFHSTEAEQYSSVVIPWAVYDPLSLTADVELLADDMVLNSLTVDRTQQIWTYRADTAGAHTLAIRCGDEAKIIPLQVNESTLDIKAETEDLILHLSSYGRSNNEAEPGIWESGDIAANFSNFNFTSDGWQMDDNKNTVLRVSGDARLEIPMQIFAKDFRTTGKTIELEFATRNILDYNAVILSCMSDGRGLELTAQKATLKSEQSEIFTQYKENEHVRLSFVVGKRAEHRLMYVYINGVMSGALQYPEDDDFSQANPANILVGSNDCTIDLYCIRIYDNNLSKSQILDNWIADTQDNAVMLERYSHNNVFDAYGQIVISKLPKDLPYMILEASVLPQSKGDKKTISGSYVDPLDSSKSFSFTGAVIDVQGTSSQYYARKNYKIKFAEGFVMNDGNTAETYAMRPNSLPVNTFTYKADVASSEGANNVELAKLYDDACPYRTPPQEADSRIRQGIDGFPMVIFWDNGETTTFLGKYNFNNDKGTPEVFGFNENDESWEILNNTSNRVLWKSDDFSGTAWKNDFEARYPEDSVDIGRLQELSTWLVSTDQSAATGNILSKVVTYGDVQYTHDTAEYRLAKFKAEVSDYFELDALLFNYLFTELFLMVDNRAKNAFPTYYDNGKWVILPYDFDTAIGTNNEGSLVFGYELEDIDKTSTGADVFNGQQSVLYINTRDSFGEELKAMYQKLRADGKLSYEDTERRFEEHQSKWPEAIFNEDSQFKYIDPLIESNTASYLTMLQGSKAEQRKWWLYNRFRYMDSKYNAGDALTDFITIRGYKKSNITIRPYAAIYASVKYGSYLVQKRALLGGSYTLECPVDTLNDTEIQIFSASQLAEVGDLSGFEVGFADFSMATKLQSMKLGDASDSYSNQNLKELYLGNNRLLKILDVRNCPNLAQAVDASGCENIEEVYFDGTAITGLSLPNGGILKKLHLPQTVSNLTILNQRNLQEFVMPSYTNITTLRLENNSNVIDPLAILDQIAANSRVRLIGISKEVENADEIAAFYDQLDTMRGLDENGNNTDKAQVSGSIHLNAITGAELAALQARYPTIKISYDNISSNLYYYNFDGSELLYTESIENGGDGSYSGKPSRTSTAQYSFNFAGWSMTPNGDADTDAQKAVAADRSVYAAYTATVRTYTVTWKNGSTTLETDNNVPYGTVPTYNGADPVYSGTDADDYEWNGWSPAVGAITGNTTYTAQFKYTGFVYTKLIDRSISGEYVNDRVESIGDYAFSRCSNLTTADFPLVTSIGDYAFSRCINLATADFPLVTSIGDYAFEICINLATADFPLVTSIGTNAFHNCSKLTTADFPLVTSIGGYAFYSCSNLTTADFPLVTSIGDSAFIYCSNLATLILRNTEKVCTLQNTSTLSGTKIKSGTGYIYVPAALIDSYKAASNWSTYAAQFRALEDYTVDGTTTGALDESKI